MKCAFFHDHKFLIKNNKVFSSGGLPAKIWDRYLNFFDELIVFGRKTENQKKGVLSQKKNVSFKLFLEKKYFNSILLGKKVFKNTINNMLQSVDCVIIRLPSLIGYYVAKRCRRLNIPYAVEVVGCQWDSYWNYGNLTGKIIAPYLYIKMKKEVRIATHVIYVTKHFLQKRYPSRGLTANASNVVIKTLSEEILKKRIQKIHATAQDITIGLLAHYNVKYKGFDVIIKALSILIDIGLIIKVKFAGSGFPDYIMNIAKKYGVESQVECIGLLKRNEVNDFLDTIDIYVHPSRQEGLPRAVIEALSRACPVLASSVGGIPELVDKKFLHHPGDYKTLSKHLQYILDEQYDLEAMAKINFSIAKSYSWRILNNKRNKFWEQFYEYARNQKKLKHI